MRMGDKVLVHGKWKGVIERPARTQYGPGFVVRYKQQTISKTEILPESALSPLPGARSKK